MAREPALCQGSLIINFQQHYGYRDVAMKTLIACYSRTGNTLKVAESLKQKLGADFTRIEPVKSTRGIFGWISEAMNARSDKTIPIKPCITDVKDYDVIVFCCPIFAGTAPAGMNEYLGQLKNYSGKKYAVAVTAGDAGKQKASIKIRDFMDKEKGQFLGMLRVTRKDLATGDAEKMVQEFAASLTK